MAAHQHHDEPAELAPLPEQLHAVLEQMEPAPALELPLLEAADCVLASDIVAPGDVPPFDNSAMDGYAVSTTDLGSDWIPIIGEVAAGAEGVIEVQPRTAVRIMTGAPVPPGADAVVPAEFTEERETEVRVLQPPVPGAHVRRAGESAQAGETVLVAGTVLEAADIGMLAALGYARAPVYPQPRVVILSTGDELVPPGGELQPGQIYDANSYALTVLARRTGASATRHLVATDDRDALADAIASALREADILVTTGGVSAGRYDLVKEVLAELGEVGFRKVAMKPGMPQVFGVVKPDGEHAVPCFGLPGNPVSAYVSFVVFVRPAIRRLQGRRDLNLPRISAELEAPVTSVEHKVEFVRVALRRRKGAWQARPTGDQGSGILRSLVAADGLAEIPVDRERMDVGERVVVHLLGGT